MDADDAIKTLKMHRGGIPREPEKMYCYRCARTVMVYRPTTEDLRRDSTLDDYIGDHYCANCIKDIVGDPQ